MDFYLWSIFEYIEETTIFLMSVYLRSNKTSTKFIKYMTEYVDQMVS